MNHQERVFAELCDALRRNDPDTTEIGYQHHTRGYGRRLGEALQGNHRVSTIFLCLKELLDVDEEGTESVSLLLRYITESEAVRKIALRSGIDARDEVIATLAPLFLQAIAENPCIESLTLNIPLVPWEAFALLLRTTQSLKTLIMTHDRGWTAASQQLVSEAFGANRTLESLFLVSYFSNTDTGMVESVLRQLGSHPCLRELTLRHRGTARSLTHFNALTHLLQSTTSLEHLKLDVWLDNECMECLFEGLHSNHSLTKLSLVSCEFDLEATDVLFSCMRSSETGSCIRELCLNMDVFGCSDAGTMLASSLIVPDENQGTGSSIGSSLEVLSLDCYFPGFYDALAANASRIRLPCLRWHLQRPYRAGENEWEALCRCLPHLVYLRDITFPQIRPNARSLNFVDAMRKNGSLQRYDYDYGDPFFNERETRLVQSFCERNEAIPILVAKVRVDSDDNDGGEDKTDLSLLPTIFEAAKQAPRTGPNSMLIALLGAGDSIGPRCGVKRVRQHALA